jgi:DNA-binding NarL/FixJ family response regulator
VIREGSHKYLDPDARRGDRPLSKRDVEIIEAIAHYGTQKTAAAVLGIAEQTIKNRMTAIYRKLGMEGNGSAVLAIEALRRLRPPFRCPNCGAGLGVTVEAM